MTYNFIVNFYFKLLFEFSENFFIIDHKLRSDYLFSQISGVILVTGKIKCNTQAIGSDRPDSERTEHLNFAFSKYREHWREDRTRNQNRHRKTRRRMTSFEKIRGVSSKRRRRIVAARNVTRRQHFLADKVFTKNCGHGFSPTEVQL